MQCVHSGAAASGGALVNYGDKFTVKFPAQGNFKFTCLIHASMNGTVHVLAPSAALPYGQLGYDLQSLAEVANITSNIVPPFLVANGLSRIYTVGKLVSTGGGWQYGSLFRFVGPDGKVITQKSPYRSSAAGRQWSSRTWIRRNLIRSHSAVQQTIRRAQLARVRGCSSTRTERAGPREMEPGLLS